MFLSSNIRPLLKMTHKIRHHDIMKWGHAVVQLVKALRYKPEGRGFDS
jgi:hypothetical protein